MKLKKFIAFLLVFVLLSFSLDSAAYAQSFKSAAPSKAVKLLYIYPDKPEDFTLRLYAGQEHEIKLKGYYSNNKASYINSGIQWKSSNPKIANIVRNKIVALNEGMVIAEAKVGSISVKIKVHVYSNELINGRGVKDIIQRWGKIKPPSTKMYVEEPRWTPPYKAGKLDKSFLQNALDMMNFVRYLAGVPDDVEMDDSLNDQAQHGAVVMAANNLLEHLPEIPKDMPTEFYDLGYKSTSSSCIAGGYRTIADSIIGYMDDNDTDNMTSVGHRTWILSPKMKKTGFGYAGGEPGYSTTQVFDTSRIEDFDYDYIAWPSKGYFPNNIISFLSPWSISLSTSKYMRPDISEIRVKLTRLSDNKVYILDKLDAQPSYTNEYFNVNNGGLGGLPYCIIFRPACDSRVDKLNGIYRVEVEGVKTIDGNNASLSYEVHFFDMK